MSGRIPTCQAPGSTADRSDSGDHAFGETVRKYFGRLGDHFLEDRLGRAFFVEHARCLAGRVHQQIVTPSLLDRILQIPDQKTLHALAREFGVTLKKDADNWRGFWAKDAARLVWVRVATELVLLFTRER